MLVELAFVKLEKAPRSTAITRANHCGSFFFGKRLLIVTPIRPILNGRHCAVQEIPASNFCEAKANEYAIRNSYIRHVCGPRYVIIACRCLFFACFSKLFYCHPAKTRSRSRFCLPARTQGIAQQTPHTSVGLIIKSCE